MEAWTRAGRRGTRWRCEPRAFYGAWVSSKNVLFVALAGHGHVTPTLPLVAELVRCGHRVDYATGPEHADAVCDVGGVLSRAAAAGAVRPAGASRARGGGLVIAALLRRAGRDLPRAVRALRR